MVVPRLHVLQSTTGDIVVRCPSADTDVIVLMVSLIIECTKRVSVDTSSFDVDISDEKKCAITVFHSFTHVNIIRLPFEKERIHVGQLRLNFFSLPSLHWVRL